MTAAVIIFLDATNRGDDSLDCGGNVLTATFVTLNSLAPVSKSLQGADAGWKDMICPVGQPSRALPMNVRGKLDVQLVTAGVAETVPNGCMNFDVLVEKRFIVAMMTLAPRSQVWASELPRPSGVRPNPKWSHCREPVQGRCLNEKTRSDCVRATCHQRPPPDLRGSAWWVHSTGLILES